MKLFRLYVAAARLFSVTLIALSLVMVIKVVSAADQPVIENVPPVTLAARATAPQIDTRLYETLVVVFDTPREIETGDSQEGSEQTRSSEPIPTTIISASDEELSQENKPSTKPRDVTEKVITLRDNSYESKVADEILTLTNKTRVENGLPALTLNKELIATARTKAFDMSTNNYFDHSNNNGCDFTCLLRDTNLIAFSWGENLLLYPYLKPPSSDTLAEETLDGWIKSPAHRDNVLNKDYTHIGIAIAPDNNSYYIVAHYATLK